MNAAHLLGLVGRDLDVELLAGVQLRGLGERLVADLIKRIGGVGDELPQGDLLKWNRSASKYINLEKGTHFFSADEAPKC